jgi:hypothetical protein
VFALVVIAGGVGCVLSFDEIAGKTCSGVADCPAPLSCVTALPDAGRTCEFLTVPVDPPPPGVSPFQGPVPQYCREILPLFDRYCAYNCHFPDFSESAITTFRLDQYSASGGVNGAKEKSAEIYRRAYIYRNMPPPGTDGVPMPTDVERSMIAHWAFAGAPNCDGGTDGG